MEIFRKMEGFPRIAPWCILVVSALACLLLYYPGLNGPFLLDDESGIKHNLYLKIDNLSAKDLKMAAFSQEPVVGLGGPLARASLALNHYYWGEGSVSFKAINLLLHLLNGGLFYMLAVLLLRHSRGREHPYSRLCSSLAAFAWLAHPLNLSVVLHVSERSTILAVFFGLLASLFYVHGRLSMAKGRLLSTAAFSTLALVCYMASVASQQEAALLLVVALMIEWFVFLPVGEQHNKSTVRQTLLVWGTVLLVTMLFVYWHNGKQADFLPANTPLSEHLLTQPRILLFYLGMIVFPRPSGFSLFHDDFALSTGLLLPPSTMLAFIAASVVGLLLLRYRHKQPVLAFFTFLFIAAYVYQGLACCTTLAGEQLNYPFSFGLLLAIVLSIMAISRSLLSLNGKVAIILVFSLFFAGVTYARATVWQDMNRWTFTTLKNHPASSDANYQAAVMYSELSQNLQSSSPQAAEYLRQAIEHFEKSALLERENAAPSLAAILLDAVARVSDKKSSLDDLLSGSTSRRIPLISNRGVMLQEAIDDLQTGILSKWTIDNLIRLSKCERSAQCQLDAEVTNDLLKSALANRSLSAASAYRAKILDELAQRLFIAGNLANAKSLALEALDIVPENARYSLNAAVIVAANGDVDLALNYVDRVLSRAHPETIKARANALRSSLKAKTQ